MAGGSSEDCAAICADCILDAGYRSGGFMFAGTAACQKEKKKKQKEQSFHSKDPFVDDSALSYFGSEKSAKTIGRIVKKL